MASLKYQLPLQVGIQVQNAAEKLARKINLWTQSAKPGEVVLQVDLKNAFNSLARQTMLDEIRTRAPLLYPYAASCYQHPAVLGQG